MITQVPVCSTVVRLLVNAQLNFCMTQTLSSQLGEKKKEKIVPGEPYLFS